MQISADAPEPDGSPFAGLKVLDFTWAAAGPVVTTFLSFLGADVVKVEHRSRPDLMRVSDKQYGYAATTGINESPLFNELASGKRSIELDLRAEQERATALRLACQADVVVENMRPGKFERLGMSHEAIKAVNPGVIMCSVSATGRSAVEGPAGYAPIFWAEGGGAWLTGWPQRPPGLVRGPVDLHVAAFGCLGILSLLHHRRTTGEGGYIDCSAVEAVAASIGVELMQAQLDAEEPARNGNEAPGFLLNDVFPCAGEDQWIAVTIEDEGAARRFADVLRRDCDSGLTVHDLLREEGRFDRIAAVTRKSTGPRLAEKLVEADIAASPSRSLGAIVSDRNLLRRGALQFIEHETIGRQAIIGLPWLVDGIPYEVRGPGPVLGADRDDVMSEWLGNESNG